MAYSPRTQTFSFIALVALAAGGIASPSAARTPAVQTAQQPRPWLYENSDVPVDPAWHFGTLRNGLRFALRRNGVPPGQVSIRVRVDAGSLMERPDELGFAHFIEHLTFRGSRKVPDGESKRLWQRLGVSFGSDSNAQTTPTGTTYALDLPDVASGGLEESISILAGMMAEPNIVPAAVEAERAIVRAEMRESTSNASKAADISRALFFAGQPLGSHAPIGTDATLKGATAEALQAFHDRWYRPENTVIAVSGDVDPREVETLIVRHFSSWRGKGKHVPLPDFGAPDPKAPPSAVAVQAGVPANISLGWLRPWEPKADTILYNQRKLADAIALQMINRRFEQAARRGDAAFLQASVDVEDISRSANVTFVSVLPAGDSWEKALGEVRAIIEDAKSSPATGAEIDREFAQYETALAISVENRDTEASAAQADTLVGAVDIRETTVTPQAALDIFRGARKLMTPDYMLDATRRMFTADATRALLVLPQEETNAQGRLAAALQAPVQPAKDVRLLASTVSMDELPKLPPPGKVVARQPIGMKGVELISFANGTKLALFANDAETGKVRVNVRFGQGLLGLPLDKAEPTWAGNYVLAANGIGKLDQRQLDELTNGRRLGFEFAIDENAFEMSALTRPADYKDQLRLFAAKLFAPGWTPGPVTRAKAGLLAAYDAASTSPNGVLGRDLQWLLRDKDVRFRTPGKAEIAALTPEKFRGFWEPVLASGPIEIQIFGDVNADDAIAAVAATFGALPPRPPSPITAGSRQIRFPDHNETPLMLAHKGDKDQAAAVIAWPTGTGLADARVARQLEILAQIISDRLFEKLRVIDGDAYSPSAQSDWPLAFDRGQGYLMVTSQMKPERVGHFFTLMREIVADLATKGVSDDELQRTLAPMRQLLLRASTSNAFWMQQLEGAGLDARYVAATAAMPRDLLGVTAEDLRALAAKYLVESKSYSVVVLPESK